MWFSLRGSFSQFTYSISNVSVNVWHEHTGSLATLHLILKWVHYVFKMLRFVNILTAVNNLALAEIDFMLLDIII